MPDCQFCWNEWQSLERVAVPALPDTVTVCRNCNRDVKKFIAFCRFHGIELAGQGGAETDSASNSSPTPQTTSEKKPRAGA